MYQSEYMEKYMDLPNSSYSKFTISFQDSAASSPAYSEKWAAVL